ncbi:MurT ligase domain-containing protein [Luteococcus sp. H138]|uniref:MurT ligase domain-containing protein n=1 Tax=unclassified Luteococcus TaxID=2639923 RepID=UPI00313E081A
MPRSPFALSDARLRAALVAGRAAALASRLTGKGSGASIRGQVLTRIDPDALGKLLANRRIAVVTGTNGKTTSTHLLTAAIRASLPDSDRTVVTNADGANLHAGIASALGEAPQSTIACLETDERVVPDVIRLGRPEVLVMLNFSRDQMDRNFEIKSLGRAWRVALEAAGEQGPVVVANANDPLVVWSAQPAHRAIWIDTGAGWTQDAALCPACGSVLARKDGQIVGGGSWACTDCELAQPEPDYRVDGEQVIERDGTVWQLELNVPGRFNRANAACALAAARVMGVEPEIALRGMTTVTSPAGRFAVGTFGDVQARLLLAKNPAGWAESLALVSTDPVVLAIDAIAADGRDVSWLWDVDFEQLQGRRVVCTGPRAHDLAVRLTYGDVEHTIEHDLMTAISSQRIDGVLDVVSTYTPFQKLRKLGGLA